MRKILDNEEREDEIELREEEETEMEIQESEEGTISEDQRENEDESEKVIRFKGRLVTERSLSDKDKNIVKSKDYRYTAEHKGEYKIIARLRRLETVLRKDRNLIKIISELRKKILYQRI